MKQDKHPQITNYFNKLVKEFNKSKENKVTNEFKTKSNEK
jgi:hypothetical protein